MVVEIYSTKYHICQVLFSVCFKEWMEFTPFEYGIRSFKIFAAMKDVASDRSQGIVSRRLPEFNVAFMQGTCW